MKTEIEIPFSWTCPKCNAAQNDTVNPELGPYLTLTCSECQYLADDLTLDSTSAVNWELARQAAEAQL